jgi:hypothetical protein
MKTRLGIGSLLAVLGLLVGLLVVPSIAGPSANLVENGDFEEGFQWGGIGVGWKEFHNCAQEEDLCTASFYEDTWAPVAYGAHSQLIEINTFCRGASLSNRYAGIYQTLAVAAGTAYEFCLHGLLRSLPGDPDPASWGYVVQVGIDQAGGTDWTAVTDWASVPWDAVHPRSAPPGISVDLPEADRLDEFCTDITAQSDKLTVFIRLWKKWPTASREVLLNLDGITFEG